MAARSGADPNARMTMIAYLTGVGEATGLMVSEAQKRGAEPVRCSNAFNLDENVALAAVTVAAPIATNGPKPRPRRSSSPTCSGAGCR